MLSRTHSVADIAARWACKPDKVLLLINRRELLAINIAPAGSLKPRWRITDEALQLFEQRRTPVAAPPQQQRRGRTRKPKFEFI